MTWHNMRCESTMHVDSSYTCWSRWAVEACGAPAIRSVFREYRWLFEMGHWGWLSGGEALACFNDVV